MPWCVPLSLDYKDLQGLNEEGTSTHYTINITFWELVLVAQKLGGQKHMLIQRLNLT